MQAIVIFPKKSSKIEYLRKKYDPLFKKVKTHVTLAFPFETKDQKELISHIENSIRKIKPFKLELRGIRNSPKEFYLYLMVKTGRKEIIRIHKSLYSSFLTNWLRKDIPYIPHVTLGNFKTKEQITLARKEAMSKKIRLSLKVDSIYLITLNKNMSLKSSKRFKLK